MCQIKNFYEQGIFHIISSTQNVNASAQNAVSFANHLIYMHFPIQIISDHDTKIILTSGQKVNCGYQVDNQQEQHGDVYEV